MKMRVYVVTFSNWQETYIDSIWSTPEQAEAKVAEYGNTEPYLVVPWDVDPEYKLKGSRFESYPRKVN